MADDELELLLGRVAHKGPQPIAVRDLLALFNAMRRGRLVVAQIVAWLEEHHLETEPSFMEVAVDEVVVIAQARNGAETEHRAPWNTKFEGIADQLQAGEVPDRVTTRDLLRWFGALRRGPYISETIAAALEEFDLETLPDFREAYIDSPLEFRTIQKSHAASDERPLTEPPAATDHPAVEDPGPPEEIDAKPRTATLMRDATFRVGTLPTANLKDVQRELITVGPGATIQEAVTRMSASGIDYLPVMPNERKVIGLVSWRRLSTCLALGIVKPSDPASKAMDPATVVSAGEALFECVDDILAHGCVLVRGKEDKITGILTTADLLRQFRDQLGPFLFLEEIENQLRRIVERAAFSLSELQSMRNPDDTRPIKNIHSLTFGEYVRIFENPEYWTRLNINLDRAEFVKTMSGVRDIRNAAMHFTPEGLTEQQDADLKKAAAFLQYLCKVGAF